MADPTEESAPGRIPIRVLIADDHPVVRQGLRTFLGVQADIEVVGAAADGLEAVTLSESLRPDVVLLDLNMPGVDGFAALEELRARGVAARVLVLTSMAERSHVLPALRAGAVGFLYKDVDPQALVQAIRAVHDGHVLIAPEAAEAMMAAAPVISDDRGPTTLTTREREVLIQIAKGLSNREIARALTVSEKTVKTHVSNIFAKLGLQDRTQAALYAVRHGLSEE